MKYIENIVIGKPLVDESVFFSYDLEDWKCNEKDKTYYTNEHFLPKILVDLGITKSISEVRRNRKDYVKVLEPFSYLEIKWGKRKLFIIVGE